MSKESYYTITIDQLDFIGVISGQSKDFNILQAKPECENSLIILLGDFLWSFFFFLQKKAFRKLYSNRNSSIQPFYIYI
jgi:hypothetical protein